MPQSILQKKKKKKNPRVSQGREKGCGPVSHLTSSQQSSFSGYQIQEWKKQVVPGVKYYSKNNFYTENFVWPSLASTLEPLKMGYYV